MITEFGASSINYATQTLDETLQGALLQGICEIRRGLEKFIIFLITLIFFFIIDMWRLLDSYSVQIGGVRII
jgi:hypothetical protein